MRIFLPVVLGILLFISGTSAEAEVGLDGDSLSRDDKRREERIAKMMELRSDLDLQLAIDIEALMSSVSKDPETSLLLRRMREGSGEEAFTAFRDDMSPDGIVVALAQTLDELKMLDILFRDPQRAVKAMEEDGMIPRDKLPAYKKNPSLLEEDTRRGLYFSFLSLAAAGGYI